MGVPLFIVDTCDCEDCRDSVAPCTLDCGRDSECSGCRESRIGSEEIEFTSACALGWR